MQATKITSLEVLFKHNLHTSLFEDFATKFETLEIEFLKNALEKLADIPTPSESTLPPISTFADKVILGPMQKIIVKPENPQEPSRTKHDLLASVNPLDHDIEFDNIRHTKDGGMVFQCSQTAEASKLH
ncbi:hypothetical protein JTB14_035585 [Gonioctena quinquepunctata]|nr:hypothetical protein JTB14_035585 [Gonioctena quinquepunctata]